MIKRRLATAAIGLHFFFVLSVVTHLHDWMEHNRFLFPIATLTNYYSAITFSNRNFGFFAPDVTADWNLSIIMTDTKGQQRPFSFVIPNSEMRVKRYSLLGHFAETNTSMDLFSRSWAIKAMNLNPDVVKVDVVVTQNYIPTMKEWARGRRIVPQHFYRTTFDVP
jgi:hypothetical protein